MEVKAKCKYDYEACRAVSYIANYRKQNPVKAIITHLIIEAALVAGNLFVITTIGWNFSNMLMLVLLSIVAVLDLFMYFVIPRLQYRSMSKMKDLENRYVFLDDYFSAVTVSEEYSAEATIRYSLLEKAFETSRYIFLFENKRQTFIVDKLTIDNGTAEQVRERIVSVLGKRYMMCKY